MNSKLPVKIEGLDSKLQKTVNEVSSKLPGKAEEFESKIQRIAEEVDLKLRNKHIPEDES